MSLFRRVILALSLIGAFGNARCLGNEISDEQLRYFERYVRPLLTESCYKCHAQSSTTVGGNLFLDSKAGWEAGGDRGAAIVPGDPQASLLIKAVRYEHDDLQMPPENRLSDSQISTLVRWIEMGAPDPRHADQRLPRRAEIDLDTGRTFWAFQPIHANEIHVPAVRNPSWPENEIDVFVLAKLEEHGLQPARQADRRTLIRRATLDLIGLPPSPDEVDAFLKDDSPDAYARLIDRLLASQHYGERWGRFWLDVARYADSNGLDENIAHGNAWRYRDYVIQSFNEDKPYDQFVLEQLAGDLLPGTHQMRNRSQCAIATGFLSLGPKVLAEVDETKMEMDIIDEQVETVGRAFMGLTLGCARCHDHKFDPIRTTDYYALAGIFKSTKTMEHFTKIARWHEVSIATEAQHHQRASIEQQLAEKQRQIDTLIQQANAEVRRRLRSTEPLPGDIQEHYDGPTRQELQQLRRELTQLEESLPELPTAMGVVDYEQPTDLHVHIRGSHLSQGDLVARGFPAVLVAADAPRAGFGNNESGRLQLAQWLVSGKHPLAARVMVNRIWRWHFGRGLVASTDNFGRLGDRPINQALLDWLACQFVKEGWSMKAMHRLIMLSRTYRMDSRFDAAKAEIDPDNHLLWRGNVRRLEAETIRDSILAVAGLLDRTMGGSLLHVGNREFLFDHTSKDETKYDSPRRSIYLPVIRNHLYDVFQLFDYADASVMNSNRPTTTVAPQALFLMNSSLVHGAAAAMADRILKSGCDADEQRLTLAYALTLGRPPTDIETKRACGYLERFARQAADLPDREASQAETAWRLLCQAMLLSNEFIYVR